MSNLGVLKEPALEVWTGLPGGGKSFQAAQLQVQWRLAGYPVITNLRMTALPNSLLFNQAKLGDYVLVEDADFTEVDESGRLRLIAIIDKVIARNPDKKHPLVLIDEAHNFYPSSNSTSSTPKAIQSFLRQHRHMGCSVLAIAQNHAMLNNNFCRLAQCFRHHKNLVKDNWLEIVLWWFGDNFHLAYSMANAGGKPFTREKYARKWFRIKKKKAKLYSTTQMHASDLQGQLAVVRGKGLRLLWLIMFLGFLYGTWRFARSFFSSPELPKAAVAAITASKPRTMHARVESVEQAGEWLRIAVMERDGYRRVVLQPAAADSFWEWSEKIGSEVELPDVNGKQFSKVVKQYAQ